jgi:hypothetical protein
MWQREDEAVDPCISEVTQPMRIPTWRLVLTGSAIVILAIVGVSLVAASSTPVTSPSTNSAVAAPAASPGTSAANDKNGNHPGLRKLLARLGRVGEGAHRFVDGTLNFTDQNGAIVTVQLDHGTIASIGSGSLTINEAGGKQVTVSTDASTLVRLGGGAGVGKLTDLKAGDEVFVQSRVDGGTTLAKHVLRVPAAASTTGG